MFQCIKMKNKAVCLMLVAFEEMLDSFTLHYKQLYYRYQQGKSSDA